MQVLENLPPNDPNNVVFTSAVTSIFYGHENVANALFSYTPLQVNAQGQATQNSMLMWSAIWGKYAMASNLLQRGADYTLVNGNGDTALSLAGKYGHRDIATLLRRYGAVK